ncbi:hypothetical protein [Shinella zoogloeoides]|uniref:hypothetical protein n=1 Tax=Shinella zoogloeoides TaxID=352475 RepID=UPI00299D5739|nr:hypothetical protein [Shinella zoogloeoides]WPE19938.1 hypothetical protein ShzoTeo12_11160 [Shinella zoogloeoides]
MINELIAAAKDSLGLRSIWLDDEEYEKIVSAVVSKVLSYEESDSRLLAMAASRRLSRLIRVCKAIKWTDLGAPAVKDAATQAALHELACFLLQDALETKAIDAGQHEALQPGAFAVQREDGTFEPIATIVDVVVELGEGNQ